MTTGSRCAPSTPRSGSTRPRPPTSGRYDAPPAATRTRHVVCCTPRRPSRRCSRACSRSTRRSPTPPSSAGSTRRPVSPTPAGRSAATRRSPRRVGYGFFEYAFEDIQVGRHVFEVRAIDVEGIPDPTPGPATSGPISGGPLTTILSGPADLPLEPLEPLTGGETLSPDRAVRVRLGQRAELDLRLLAGLRPVRRLRRARWRHQPAVGQGRRVLEPDRRRARLPGGRDRPARPRGDRARHLRVGGPAAGGHSAPPQTAITLTPPDGSSAPRSRSPAPTTSPRPARLALRVPCRHPPTRPTSRCARARSTCSSATRTPTPSSSPERTCSRCVRWTRPSRADGRPDPRHLHLDVGRPTPSRRRRPRPWDRRADR